jgi:hypothetical protein
MDLWVQPQNFAQMNTPYEPLKGAVEAQRDNIKEINLATLRNRAQAMEVEDKLGKDAVNLGVAKYSAMNQAQQAMERQRAAGVVNQPQAQGGDPRAQQQAAAAILMQAKQQEDARKKAAIEDTKTKMKYLMDRGEPDDQEELNTLTEQMNRLAGTDLTPPKIHANGNVEYPPLPFSSEQKRTLRQEAEGYGTEEGKQLAQTIDLLPDGVKYSMVRSKDTHRLVTLKVAPADKTTPKTLFEAVEQSVESVPGETPAEHQQRVIAAYKTASPEKSETRDQRVRESLEVGRDGRPTAKALEAKKILDEEDRRAASVAGAKTAAEETAKDSSNSGPIDLSKVSDEDMTMAKQLLSYSLPITSYELTRNPKWERRMHIAATLDPSFDASQYNIRQSVKKDFTVGKSSQNITGLNTAVGHIDSLTKTYKDLDNSDWSSANAAMNALSKYFPVTPGLVARQGKTTAIKTKFNAVKGELASIFKKSGASDVEIKSWESTIDNPTTATKSSWQAFISGAIELMGSRMQELTNTYERGMGKPKDYHFLSDRARGILKGLNIDPDMMDSATPIPTDKAALGKDVAVGPITPEMPITDVAKMTKMSEADAREMKKQSMEKLHPDYKPQIIGGKLFYTVDGKVHKE